MFTLRLFQSYRVFQLLLILIVSSAVVLGQTNKKCAEFNEYCQMHWDCCSNSCMSYNYRCTRGYNVHKDPYKPDLNKPTMTLDDILYINFGNQKTANYNEIPTTETKPYFINRFGNEDTTEVKIILQNSQETTEGKPLFENRIGETEKSQQPEYKVTQGVEVISTKPEEKVTTVTESQLVGNKDGVTVLDLMEDKKQDEPCKIIGLKCYTNDECCSKRCHGFLHQCVT